MTETPKTETPTPTRLQRAVQMHRQGRLDEAAALYEPIAQDDPGAFEALYLLGLLRFQQGRMEDACERWRAAVAANPQSVEAVAHLGLALKHLRRPEEALARFDRALALQPDYADAHLHRAETLLSLRRAEAAAASYDRALALRPDDALTFGQRGNALQMAGRLDEALASYDRALALKPDFCELHVNRGLTLKALARLDEAVAAYDGALALRPGLPAALANRGNALCDLHRAQEALADYDAALAVEPQMFEAHYGRGNALRALRRLEEALASYDRALTIRPDHAEALNNRGHTRQDLGRVEEGLADFDAALAIKPDLAEAHFNRAGALTDLRRWEEALAAYDRARALKPDFATLRARTTHAKMFVCDWAGLEDDVAAVVAEIEAGTSAFPPFGLLGLIDDPRLHRKLVQRPLDLFARDTLGAWSEPTRRDKIRVGYFSADFHTHPTAFQIAGLFEKHDRDKFEIHAFSFGPRRDDHMRKRIAAGVDRFVDLSALSDRDAALLARSREIDVAVDLMGYTTHCRPEIFAYGAAPIQVSYLGFPATQGVGHIDYVIADPVVVPEQAQAHFCEKIAYLPHCYFVNDDRRVFFKNKFARAEVGLPETGFVFCCFNNNYKIKPDIFDIWMNILRQVDGAVLWLLEDNATATRHLRREASLRGVDPQRLAFAPRAPYPIYLARFKSADLFLDTLPYNAHTTASDALWMGVPVLTRPGRSFASRVATSLLNAIGLPELVAPDAQVYERLAVELAHDPERLGALRARLAEDRLKAPLFDTALFARHMEAALTAMHERRLAGQGPDHIHAPA